MSNSIDYHVYRCTRREGGYGDWISAMQFVQRQLIIYGEGRDHRQRLIDTQASVFRSLGDDEPERAAYENFLCLAGDSEALRNAWLPFLEEYRKDKGLKRSKRLGIEGE